MLQEYLATEPRLYLFSLLAVAIDIVPFCGAGDSEQKISVCVKQNNKDSIFIDMNAFEHNCID